MLVVDMYHQYHSRLTRGCLARGSRGDDSSGERSHARAFLSGGLVVLASRCVWREVRGSVPRRPHVSRGSGAGSSARPGQPVRATAGRFPRLEEELNILIVERPPSKTS